jgi:hypothetical protein
METRPERPDDHDRVDAVIRAAFGDHGEIVGHVMFTASLLDAPRRPSLRIPEAAFQALELPAHEPWMTGTHVYAAAFWSHDAVGLRDDPAGGDGPAPARTPSP